MTKIDNKNLFLFSFFTLIYIGCDNAFILGIFFQFLFIFIFSNYKLKTFFNKLIKIYLNIFSIFFIILPILAYLIVTLILWFQGIEEGYILNLISKKENISLKFFENFFNLLFFYGPVSILIFYFFIKNIFFNRNNYKNKIFLFFLTYFFTYYFLISVANLQNNYLMVLSVPLLYFLMFSFKEKYIKFLYFIVFLNLFYSLSVVYNYGFEINKNNKFGIYGFMDHKHQNNDMGIKSLGYLIRNQNIKISKIKPVNNKYFPHDYILGIFLPYEGGEYYLGNRYINITEKNKKNIIEINSSKFDKYIFIEYEKNNFYKKKELNLILKRYNLNKAFDICKNNKPLINVYSNFEINLNNCVETKTKNNLFDLEYGNIKMLPKIYLGQF